LAEDSENHGKILPQIGSADLQKSNSYDSRSAGPNGELRTREYLTDIEVDQLTDAAKGNRYGLRDATLILLAYRHHQRRR
jgi:hypothetical protein